MSIHTNHTNTTRIILGGFGIFVMIAGCKPATQKQQQDAIRDSGLYDSGMDSRDAHWEDGNRDAREILVRDGTNDNGYDVVSHDLDIEEIPGNMDIQGEEQTCTPNCDNKSCGDDGCGGSCGTCKKGEKCVSGKCKSIGTIKWKFSSNGNGDTGPGIGSDGTIYAEGHSTISDKEHYYLNAINPDGTLKWKFDVDDLIGGTPVIGKNDIIYLTDFDSYLYAVKPDGSLKWKVKIGEEKHQPSTPAIGVDGTIYAGNKDGHTDYLYAVSPKGMLKWKTETPGWTAESISVGSDGTIYVAGDGLMAINPDGSVKWSAGEPSMVFYCSSIGQNNTIYVGADDGLYAINHEGTIIWKFQPKSWVRSCPAIGTDKTIYITLSRFVYAINPDGTLKWKFDTNDGVESSPAIGSDGVIYAGNDNGDLYALNPDGTLEWKINTIYGIKSYISIGMDGTVYFTNEGGYLYAVTSSSQGLAKSCWPKAQHDNRNSGRYTNTIGALPY